MVAIFVFLMFGIFILIDFVLYKSKWIQVMKNSPSDIPTDIMLNDKSVGYTMADGQPEETDKN